VARSTGELWPLHDLLQSLRSLAASWHLGPDHGCAGRRSRCGWADDRYLYRARAPARRPASRATDGNIWTAREAVLRARFTPSWTPTACRRSSTLRPARLMTIGFAQHARPGCIQKQFYLQTVAMMRTGSGRPPTGKERGLTFRRNAIARSQSASALTCIERETWLSDSSTRSSSVGGLPLATTNSQPTTLPSSSSHQSGPGYGLRNPRPNPAGARGSRRSG
jgi:hypothetical protein